jgi:hypothetical protein
MKSCQEDALGVQKSDGANGMDRGGLISPKMSSPAVGVCEMASSFASSLVAEREGERVQVREEVGAHFIGMKMRQIRQVIN